MNALSDEQIASTLPRPAKVRRARRWNELSDPDVETVALAQTTLGILDGVNRNAERHEVAPVASAEDDREREAWDRDNEQDRFDGGRLS